MASVRCCDGCGQEVAEDDLFVINKKQFHLSKLASELVIGTESREKSQLQPGDALLLESPEKSDASLAAVVVDIEDDEVYIVLASHQDGVVLLTEHRLPTAKEYSVVVWKEKQTAEDTINAAHYMVYSKHKFELPQQFVFSCCICASVTLSLGSLSPSQFSGASFVVTKELSNLGAPLLNTAVHSGKQIVLHSATIHTLRNIRPIIFQHAARSWKSITSAIKKASVPVVFIAIDTIVLGYDIHLQKQLLNERRISRRIFSLRTAEYTGKLAGKTVGSLGGTAIGSMVGSMIFPGVGTIVGAVVGSVVGSAIGGTSGGYVGKSVCDKLITL